MSRTITLLVCLAASVASFLGIAGIASADEQMYYQIRIRDSDTSLAGSAELKARLTKFVEQLRSELNVENLGDANVGCDRCGELVQGEKVEGGITPGRELDSLRFATIRSGSQLEAFARSYDIIQASALGKRTFTMEVDAKPPPSSACTASQVSAGCKTRPLCVQTAGCDKVYGGSCNLCPP